MSLRIGNGYDVHAFDDGRQGIDKIVIGGVMIPHTHGLMAHSDGDVLLHALCDALLCGVARQKKQDAGSLVQMPAMHDNEVKQFLSYISGLGTGIVSDQNGVGEPFG